VTGACVEDVAVRAGVAAKIELEPLDEELEKVAVIEVEDIEVVELEEVEGVDVEVVVLLSTYLAVRI
jgi:hypothetical protein